MRCGSCAVLCACALLSITATMVAMPARAELDSAVALATSQQAVGRKLGEYEFVDSEGGSFALSATAGKPLIVSLIYTSCPDTCSILTSQLVDIVDIAREAIGEDAFRVVSVGFDADGDTPARLHSYARAQGAAGDARWRFVTADRATLGAFTRDVGFSFQPSPRGFDHLAQITIVDADQRVYRQVYGDVIEPPAIVEPLKELVFDTPPEVDRLQAWVDGIRLLCTVYDPASGRYRFDYSVVVAAVIGTLCLGWLGYFLLSAWRQHRRPPAI